MQRLERVLPTFVFVVMLGANLLNVPTFSVPLVLGAIFMAAVPGLIVFVLIKLLMWWLLR